MRLSPNEMRSKGVVSAIAKARREYGRFAEPAVCTRCERGVLHAEERGNGVDHMGTVSGPSRKAFNE